MRKTSYDLIRKPPLDRLESAQVGGAFVHVVKLLAAQCTTPGRRALHAVIDNVVQHVRVLLVKFPLRLGFFPRRSGLGDVTAMEHDGTELSYLPVVRSLEYHGAHGVGATDDANGDHDARVGDGVVDSHPVVLVAAVCVEQYGDAGFGRLFEDVEVFDEFFRRLAVDLAEEEDGLGLRVDIQLVELF